MSLFGQSASEKEDVAIINRLLGIVENLTQCKAHPVSLVLTTTINNSKFSIMALSIASNQKALGTLGLVDATTSASVTGTFTGVSAVSDATSAFTASVDTSNNVTVTGVAAGVGKLTVTATAAYTDSTGAVQSKVLTVEVDVTITAVVVADVVNLVITFGPATAQ